MALKAYRVTQIMYVPNESFSLLYDTQLVKYLQDKHSFFVLMEEDGIGLALIPTDALEEALQVVYLREDAKAAIKRDIEACKQRGWIRYMFTEPK